MPKYRVELSDGRTFEVEADAPPSEQDVLGALGNVSAHDERGVGDFLTRTLPQSASRFAKSAVDAVTGAAGTVAEGWKTLLTDPSEALERVKGVQNLPTAAAGATKMAGQYLKDRFGSLDAIGDTLYNDPVGALADLSTVTGAGAALRVPKVAGALRTVSAATNPVRAVTVPAAAAARAVAPRFGSTALSVYERLLKPNRTSIEGLPSSMGRTLEEKSRAVARELISDPNGQISRRGADAFEDATQALQGEVDDLVAANPTATGSSRHLARELAGGRRQFRNQLAPSGDVGAYTAVADDVLQNPKLTDPKYAMVPTQSPVLGPNGQPVTTMQRVVVGRQLRPQIEAQTIRPLAQGTYRAIGDRAYGELKGAATEAHKAAARGGRKILNEAIPEVEPLNNTIAHRIDLGQILDEAVFRSGKHNPVGLTETIAASGRNPGMILGAVLNRPMLGSPLARGAYRAAGRMAGAQAGAGIGALAARGVDAVGDSDPVNAEVLSLGLPPVEPGSPEYTEAQRLVTNPGWAQADARTRYQLMVSAVARGSGAR